VLFEYSYDATPANAHDPHRNHVFATTAESRAVALQFNTDEALRTCKRCGKVSPPFPHQAWGWENHTLLHTVAALGRRNLAATEAVR
jgi:hypothetical protein